MATAQVPPLEPPPTGGAGGTEGLDASLLPAAARKVLAALAREGASSVEELRRATGLSRPTVEAHVSRLQDLGYVRRDQPSVRTALMHPIGRRPRRIALARGAGYGV